MSSCLVQNWKYLILQIFLPELLCHGAICIEKDNWVTTWWIQTQSQPQEIIQNAFSVLLSFKARLSVRRIWKITSTVSKWFCLICFCEIHWTHYARIKWICSKNKIWCLAELIKFLLDYKLLKDTDCIAFIFESLLCQECSRHPLNSYWFKFSLL